jgi:hypothetical protein
LNGLDGGGFMVDLIPFFLSQEESGEESPLSDSARDDPGDAPAPPPPVNDAEKES